MNSTLETAVATALEFSPQTATYSVLGVRVHALQIPGVVAQMLRWIDLRSPGRYIAVTGMHGVSIARRDPAFREILRSAGLVVADGMPLVWLGRRAGFHMPRRVYGPELMLAFCEASAPLSLRHFFYGGAPGVPEQLAETLATHFPGLQIASSFSPPYRPLTPPEEEKIVAHINNSHPDVLWVGLSTPKQEQWMHAFCDRLNVPVLVGVGAAFDIHTRRVSQAPFWMRENGLEWLFRFSQEPRRLWRRTFINGSQFAFYVLLERLRLKRFE